MNKQLFIGVGAPASVLFPAVATAQQVQDGFDPTEVVSLPQWYGFVGAAVCLLPAIVGSSEFVKRILIQRRCATCEGAGLVRSGERFQKCYKCGGMFPWLGWRMFFLSSIIPKLIGNGGPLQYPRGQTSIFFKVPEIPAEKFDQAKYTSADAMSAAQETPQTAKGTSQLKDKQQTGN